MPCTTGGAALDGSWDSLSFAVSRKERTWVRLQGGEVVAFVVGICGHSPQMNSVFSVK